MGVRRISPALSPAPFARPFAFADVCAYVRTDVCAIAKEACSRTKGLGSTLARLNTRSVLRSGLLGIGIEGHFEQGHHRGRFNSGVWGRSGRFL